MGDPKMPRRVWKKPKRPLNYDLMMDELKTLGTFGLKTKKELWKTQTEFSEIGQRIADMTKMEIPAGIFNKIGRAHV